MAAEAGAHDGWDGDREPWAPVFFFSYARAGRYGKEAGEFFDDLSQDVAELVGRPAGSDPGFIDRSMGGGEEWFRELLRAVGTCQVFVALLSDPYVASPYCSQEWYAFTRRRVLSRATGIEVQRTGVIPVIWTPMPPDRMPPEVGNVQWFTPRGMAGTDIVAQYQEEGVYGFRRLSWEAEYRCVVWRLAQRIASFYFAYRVEPLVLDPSDLRDIFRERQL